jgi:hypothetical protein
MPAFSEWWIWSLPELNSKECGEFCFALGLEEKHPKDAAFKR